MEVNPDHPNLSVRDLLKFHMKSGTGRTAPGPWTIEELASKSKTSSRAISNWLGGLRPSNSSLDQIMWAFGLVTGGWETDRRDEQQRRYERQFRAARERQVSGDEMSAQQASEEAWKLRLQPRPDLQDESFCGRRSETRAVIGLLSKLDGRRRVVSIFGVPGMGKSRLAAHLSRDEALGHLFPDGTFWVSFGVGAEPEIARYALLAWAKALGFDLDDATVDSASDSLRGHLLRARALFIVDDAFNAELAKYMLVGGAQCGHIVTSRHAGIAHSLTDSEQVIELKKLDAPADAEVLQALAPNAFAFPGTQLDAHLSKRLRDIDGHPMMLRLLGFRLKDCRSDTYRLREALRHFEADDVEKAIRSSARVLPRPAQNALSRLCKLQPDPSSFSAALAKRVIGGKEAGHERILEQLVDSGLVSATAFPPADLIDEIDLDEFRFFSIHQVPAEALSARLDDKETEAQEIFAEAVAYFLEKLAEQEDETNTFGAWLRHERPNWQEAMFAMRYYLARGTDYERAAFILTRAWINAWWWWCTFTSDGFTFCDQLLESWPRSLDASGNLWSEDLKDLQGMKEHYPNESSRAPDGKAQRDDWDRVRYFLQRLRKRRGLDDDSRLLDNGRNDLRGLLNIYIAESYRFGGHDREHARALYIDAVECFARQLATDSECWTLSWGRYHLADFLGEARDPADMAQAEELCRRVIGDEMVKRRGDQEVLARTYHLLGLLALHDGRCSMAASCLHNAAYWAYRYQLFPHMDLTEGRPDEYTAGHYRNVGLRVAREILAHSQRSRTALSEASSVAAAIAGFWPEGHAPTLEELVDETPTEAQVRQLAQRLFPPTLSASDVKDKELVEAFKVQCRMTLTRVVPHDIRKSDASNGDL